MRYFILLVCTASFCFAQGTQQKPQFLWETIHADGIMARGSYKFFHPFDQQSVLVISEQLTDTSFSLRFFQKYNILSGEEVWTKPGEVEGKPLDIPIAPTFYYQPTKVDNKILISSLAKPAGDLGSTFSFRRQFSIDYEGNTKFERLYENNREIFRAKQLKVVDQNEYIYLSELISSEQNFSDSTLFNYEKDGIISSFPLKRFSMMHSSQWNLSNAWKRADGKIDFILASYNEDTNCISFRTLDVEKETISDVSIMGEELGLTPDAFLTVRDSKKIDNFYYVVVDVGYYNAPDNILLKLDQDGKVLKQTGFSGYSSTWGIEKGPNNSIILYGGTFIPNENPNTKTNHWIAQFDSELNKMNEFVWGTNEVDITTVAKYYDGIGLLTGGYYNKSGNGSTLIMNANIGLIPESVFLDVSSVQENAEKHLKIQIIENSATNQTIVLTSEKEQNATIKIIDQNGRFVSLLSQGPISIGEHRFTVPSSLTNGMYLVVCEQNGTTIASEKFIVKK